MNGEGLVIGQKVDWAYGKARINKHGSKRDTFNLTVYYGGNPSYKVEVNFDEKSAKLKFGKYNDDGVCYPF